MCYIGEIVILRSERNSVQCRGKKVTRGVVVGNWKLSSQ